MPKPLNEDVNDNSGHTPDEWGVTKNAKLKQNVIVAYDVV